jgi:hypothetical protein
LGRPRVIIDRSQIALLRAEGLSWAKIASKLNIGEGTVYRMVQASAKISTNSPSVSHCNTQPTEVSFNPPQTSVFGTPAIKLEFAFAYLNETSCLKLRPTGDAPLDFKFGGLQ